MFEYTSLSIKYIKLVYTEYEFEITDLYWIIIHQPNIFQFRIKCLALGTPWNFVQGGLIHEMIQVCDYDILIVLVELNKFI